MSPHDLLPQIVIVYAIAVALIVVTARFRVPSIVALIAAGVLAGPSSLGLVGDQHDVETLSEIGVALLLFMAGLDFSIGELRRVWRSVLIGGTGQVAITMTLAGGIVAFVAAGSFPHLFVIGLFVALSSTAIVLKELNRLNHAHAPHGRLAIGVLLLQDLIVICVLVFAPMIFGTAAAENPAIGLARLALVLGGVFLTSRVALPLLLRLVSGVSREAFSVAVLLASVGTAYLTSLLGLSMAVGAFLAGLVLAESEFSHQVHAEVRPLRDLLASLFFISVGLLVDPRQMSSALPALVVVALSQIGEFSFVLGRGALESGVLSPNEWQTLLGASILTMAASPGLVALAPAIGARLARAQVPSERGETFPEMSGHVIILGYGVGGRLLSRVLSEMSVPYLILELNGANVREGRSKNQPIFYADATVADSLAAAGAARAAAIVALLSDPDATQRAVRAVRSLSSHVPVLVRTRYRGEAERMTGAGATIAIAEELEGSLEILAQLLSRLQVPGNVVEVLLDTYRRATTAAPRGRIAPAVPFAELPVEVAHAPVATFRLEPSMWGVGRTLGDLDLRAATGATVLAVRRDGRTFTSPDSHSRLNAGDTLYLLGDDADVRLARARLASGPRSAQSPVV